MRLWMYQSQMNLWMRMMTVRADSPFVNIQKKIGPMTVTADSGQHGVFFVAFCIVCILWEHVGACWPCILLLCMQFDRVG